MALDVVDLKEFYLTPLGQTARRMIRRRIRMRWPSVAGATVLGLGYATPYLRPFRDEAARLLAFMPAAQGVCHWPDEGPCQTALVEDLELPLPDASVDRILLVHQLETCGDIREMLREVWRVLAPSGRVLVVVPNRRGLWARFETTPLGQGQPFSPRQLSRVLADAMLSPAGWDAGLFMPPVEARLVLRWAGAWESLGANWWRRFAGILLVEATKQIYAVKPRRQVRRLSAPVTIPLPALQPGVATALAPPRAADGTAGTRPALP